MSLPPGLVSSVITEIRAELNTLCPVFSLCIVASFNQVTKRPPDRGRGPEAEKKDRDDYTSFRQQMKEADLSAHLYAKHLPGRSYAHILISFDGSEPAHLNDVNMPLLD
jgi:hypothetical protein